MYFDPVDICADEITVGDWGNFFETLADRIGDKGFDLCRSLAKASGPPCAVISPR